MASQPAADLRVPGIPLATKMMSIAGSADLIGWGGDECPWFGGNPADKPVKASVFSPAHTPVFGGTKFEIEVPAGSSLVKVLK